jgi:spore coat polysaccharide biosynthesis predicted glycosyltransferase SpsG
MNRMLMLLDKRFALIAISEVLIQQIGKFWNFYEELYCKIPSKYIDTMYTQLQIEHYFDKSKEAVEYQITDPNDNPLTLKAIMFMYSYIQHIGIISELESILTNASQINNFPMLYLNGLYEQLIALYNIDYS